jgi:hypothetical protein
MIIHIDTTIDLVRVATGIVLFLFASVAVGGFVLAWLAIPGHEPQRYSWEEGFWVDLSNGDWDWEVRYSRPIFRLQGYLVIKIKRLLGRYPTERERRMFKGDTPITIDEFKKKRGLK